MGFVHHFSYPSVQKYDKNLRIYLGSWSEGEICHGEEDTEPGTAWFMMAEMCSWGFFQPERREIELKAVLGCNPWTTSPPEIHFFRLGLIF